MKSKSLKFISLMLAASLVVLSFAGCGGKKEEEAKTINIAYQYGLAYAPLIIAQKNNTIENAYKEATGEELTVNWVQMNSGADINTGIAAGEIDVGFMGIGPAITGVAKKVGYKIFTNLSGQEHGLMVNDDSVNSLSDLVGGEGQIAVVNIGSIQHIMLAMALANEGLDPHALDDNLIAMKHPDGMTSLETGSVIGHVTSSPYIFKEAAEDGLHSIDAVANAWSKDNSFIVGVASVNMHDNEKEVYDALCDGIGSAMDFINGDIDAAAELTYELNGNTIEDEKEYLAKGSYVKETKGVKLMADFMFENGFTEVSAGEYTDIVFDNVVGD